MLRLDRQRLLNATFAAKVEIPLRFDDLDVQGHVNNVAVAVLFQEARGRFNSWHLSSFLGRGHGLVVGSLMIDYAGQMHYPEPVEIDTGVLEIGSKSYQLGQIARQNGTIAAFAEVIMVVTQDGKGTTIPDEVRATLERALITP